jgi:hypothetical protein
VFVCLFVNRNTYSFWWSTIYFRSHAFGNVQTIQFLVAIHEKTQNQEGPYFDKVILRNGSQVLPFLKYPRDLTNNANLLFELQKSLQLQVDRFYNNGHTTLTNFPRLSGCSNRTQAQRLSKRRRVSTNANAASTKVAWEKQWPISYRRLPDFVPDRLNLVWVDESLRQ